MKDAEAESDAEAMTIEMALERAAISVPDAGRLFFGLSRNGAYDAAKRGDIPTIKAGNRFVVPVVPLAAKFGLRAKLSGAA